MDLQTQAQKYREMMGRALNGAADANDKLKNLTTDPSCGPAMRMALQQVIEQIRTVVTAGWADLNGKD